MRYLAAFCLLFCLAALPALAADGVKPSSTGAATIAMLYKKLTLQDPDFSGWVENSSQYQNAQIFERPDMLTHYSGEMQGIYSLITPNEPLIVAETSKISSYSVAAGGFLVGGFQEMTFFDYVYLGEHYALVPHGLMAYQWLKAPASFTDTIMQETLNGNQAHLVLKMMPMSADEKPLVINNIKYHLIMADITTIELWSADNTKIIWDGSFNAPGSVQSQLQLLHQ